MSFGRKFEWAEHIDTAVEVMERCATAAQAAELLSAKLGWPVNRKSLLSAMARAYQSGLVDRPAAEIINAKAVSETANRLKSATTNQTKQATPKIDLPSQNNNPELLRVVRAVQGGIASWHELADHLDLSPRRTKDLVEAAIDEGHDIQINNSGELSFELPPATVTAIENVPVDGQGWTIIGVMSDMHVGSKHCMEDDMVRFVEQAYSEGVRQLLIPGDLCEGNLRHHGFQFEVKHPDYDSQVGLLLELLPQKNDLKYYFCVGNHEVNSWFKTIGMRPDRAIERDAKIAGRSDIIAVGAMSKAQESAYVVLNQGDPETEIKVELSHTSDKKAYAISYPLQKHVEAMQPGAKPHVLLKGHLHSHSFFDLRGVVCVQTGCFKDQGTWERQKNMQPQVGGVVLWLRHAGRYFDAKHHWMAVRPAPMVWEPIG